MFEYEITLQSRKLTRYDIEKSLYLEGELFLQLKNQIHAALTSVASTNHEVQWFKGPSQSDSFTPNLSKQPKNTSKIDVTFITTDLGAKMYMKMFHACAKLMVFVPHFRFDDLQNKPSKFDPLIEQIQKYFDGSVNLRHFEVVRWKQIKRSPELLLPKHFITYFEFDGSQKML